MTLVLAFSVAGCGGGSEDSGGGGEVDVAGVQKRLQAAAGGEEYEVRCEKNASTGEKPPVECNVKLLSPFPSDEILNMQDDDYLRFAEREWARSEPGAGVIRLIYFDADDGNAERTFECRRSSAPGEEAEGSGFDMDDCQ